MPSKAFILQEVGTPALLGLVQGRLLCWAGGHGLRKDIQEPRKWGRVAGQ